MKNSTEWTSLLGLTGRVKAFVSAPMSDNYSRRVNDLSTFLDDSSRRLKQTLAIVTSRLESWEKWSSQSKKLEEDLEKMSSTLKLVLKEVNNSTSSHPSDVLKKKHEAISKLHVSFFSCSFCFLSQRLVQLFLVFSLGTK